MPATAEPDSRRHSRERRWQAAHRVSGWSNSALAATAAGRDAAALMRRRQVEVLIGDVERFDTADVDPDWTDVAGIGDLLVRLTPGSVTALWDAFYAHLDALVAGDAGDPDARPVSIVVAAFPRTDPR